MKHSLTSGSIWRGMLFFALPILLGNIFQQLYNTADAFIVGRFLDKNAYAAVSSSGSLIFLLVGFFNGIAVGAGVVIARYYGAKDNEKLQTAAYDAGLRPDGGHRADGARHDAHAAAAAPHEDGCGRAAELHRLFPDVFCGLHSHRHV